MKSDRILLPRENRRVGKALADYSMLKDGDRILVAVSGGVDSMVLAWLLHAWRDKAPVDYTLRIVTVENNFQVPDESVEKPSAAIIRQLATLGITTIVQPGLPLTDEERTCFICARNRRNQLFERARQEGYNKIALGHHKDDLVETLFINLLYGGNISTMLPRQDLFDGKLSLIRPLAYLEKKDILEIAERLGVEPVENLCPFSGDTRREKVREMLETIYRLEPEAKGSIFAAMSNVRHDYLLQVPGR